MNKLLILLAVVCVSNPTFSQPEPKKPNTPYWCRSVDGDLMQLFPKDSCEAFVELAECLKAVCESNCTKQGYACEVDYVYPSSSVACEAGAGNHCSFPKGKYVCKRQNNDPRAKAKPALTPQPVCTPIVDCPNGNLLDPEKGQCINT